jgi:hypothetical protein
MGVRFATNDPRRRRSHVIQSSDYKSPYVQNITMALQRQVSRNLTLTTSYIGTLSVKQFSTFSQFNSANFLYNGLGAEFGKYSELVESPPLLDSMFRAINLCVTACPPRYGWLHVVGSTNSAVSLQTAATQMRSSPTFNTNLAMGNFSALASFINTLNYAKVGCRWRWVSLETAAAGSAHGPQCP